MGFHLKAIKKFYKPYAGSVKPVNCIGDCFTVLQPFDAEHRQVWISP